MLELTLNFSNVQIIVYSVEKNLFRYSVECTVQTVQVQSTAQSVQVQVQCTTQSVQVQVQCTTQSVQVQCTNMAEIQLFSMLRAGWSRWSVQEYTGSVV